MGTYYKSPISFVIYLLACQSTNNDHGTNLHIQADRYLPIFYRKLAYLQEDGV